MNLKKRLTNTMCLSVEVPNTNYKLFLPKKKIESDVDGASCLLFPSLLPSSVENNSPTPLN